MFHFNEEINDMKIAVFCSANRNIDPDFFAMTEELGKWMGENGHDVVFGGCNMGLMDCIGKAVKANGGRAIGVVPSLVEKGGKTFDDLDVEIPCDNLSDRKDLLLARATSSWHCLVASARSMRFSPLPPHTPSAITTRWSSSTI